MGYYSDVTIAVDLSVVVQDLLHPIIPSLLKEWPHQDINGSRYWKLTGVKWYDSFQDIAEIEAFFNALDDMTRRPDPSREDYPSLPIFGALRIGEDRDDYQQWGEPEHFDIQLRREIESPWKDPQPL